ncbi:hypothetical protein K2173_002673 [Erythroxylum novogranatense]|uniref:Mannosyl-oligosaccharide glucosidase n=1 Tax=Erythroxylum novogranatense TaxID=1862640 RepID=A0AAV8SY96_9ROSI|nr:hypothetical protein K2173_002673 [Erythroxylum novogranatense]
MTGSSRRPARSRIKSSAHGEDEGSDASIRRDKPNLKLRRDRSKHHSAIRIFDVELRILIGIGATACVIIFFLIQRLVKPLEESTRPGVITPFPAPKLTKLPQFQGEHRESLYWGTYRPQVYLGVRARTPRSLVAGLMWLGVKDGRYAMRHMCQDSDELTTYSWTEHNGRDYGKQVLVDQDLKLETYFLKSKSEYSGYGGDWAVQIDTQTQKSNEMLRNGHLFFYLADEDGSALSLGGNILDIRQSSLLASGSRTDVGGWQLHLVSKDALEVHYAGFRTPHIHNLSDLVLHDLGAQARRYGELKLSDSLEDFPNILVFQIFAEIPFKIDFAFVSGTGKENPRIEERVVNLTGTSLRTQLKVKQMEFDAKFQKCFNITDKVETEAITVGKVAIANMLGGIGYFYGQSKISYPTKINQKVHNNFLAYWPAELYTAVPSRPFFPRGFLWDEGFHQLLIWRWDISICLDIIGHWLDLMNIEGWIPREQILGAEAVSKVPEEFVLQHPTNGNPPMLFLAIRDLIDGVEKNKFTPSERNDIISFLDKAFVRLQAWFQWFNTTQSGKEMSAYFWHGRDNMTTRELNPKTLSSGLDDYPRASHPNEEERHVDLRCWMLLAANCMHSISRLVMEKSKFEKDYGLTAKMLADFEILNQMHLDPTYGAYFDFGNHTEKVRLSWKETHTGGPYATREMLREVLERPELRFVPHIGYASLFPFIAKIIPSDSWILDKQLDFISNRSILWTDYGLRSLAKTSSLYMKRNTEHDPPYWRGPIWMNLNYLIISAVYHYSKVEGPYKDRAKVIYTDLRSNLIRNVVNNYYQTGYMWEQYEQKKGRGKGARVFTGWTALVLLIMSESYC